MGAARTAVRIGNSLSAGEVKRKSSTRKVIEKKIPAHATATSTLDTSGGIYSINTPRQVRVRLASAQPGRRAVRGRREGTSQELRMQHGPSSPIAASRSTGRTAMGPWCGPFGASQVLSNEPPSPTLYLDRTGSAHFSLESLSAAPKDALTSSGPPQALPLVTAGTLGGLPPNVRRAELRDHSREVRLAATKGEPKRSGGSRSPRFSTRAKRHAGHQVFQPSGRFY